MASGHRMKRRNLLLDRASGLVLRRIQQLLMIVSREVIRQQADRGQRDRSVRKPIENDREISRRARGLDASVCGMLREAQTARAVCEQRRISLL